MWSEKVMELLNNKEKLKELSKNSYEHAQKFSIKLMAKQATDVYMQAIEEYKRKKG